MFLRWLLIVAVVATLAGCKSEQQTTQQSQEPATLIHPLTASTDKRYVEIQPVGEFPRRPDPIYQEIRLEKSVLVPMRDGIRLATDIYSPVAAQGPLPVVLIRLPYNKNRYIKIREPGSDAYFFAGHGYHVVVQDMRGRYESEGKYVVSAANREDGYDTVEWLSQQPWSTGKVGTYGCSYLGENQLQLAAARHPNHLAAIPQAAGGGYRGTDRQFGVFSGGVAELATGLGWFWSYGAKQFFKRSPDMSDEEFRTYADLYEPWPQIKALDFQKAFWHLPTIDIISHFGGARTDYEDFFSHSPRDPYWDDLNYVHKQDRFDVPALHIDSWFDGVSNENMEMFNLFRTNAVSDRARDHQYAIMSPTAHCASEFQPDWENAVIGALPVGDISKDYFRIYLDWFDHWLKGVDNGITDMPKFQYYAMGSNEWRSADEWPIKNTAFTKFFLHSGGDANKPDGSGGLSLDAPVSKEASDHFSYDPSNPVPSTGGPICCISKDAAPAGSYDQKEVEARADVLLYTSAPLEQDMEVTGPLRVILFVSSSAKDTDFTVKLVDVNPDGSSFNIQDSILRARYRDGYDKQIFMEPGGVYKLDIDLHATGNVFLTGPRIRLPISSSNFPRFVRNLNTGGNNYDETEWVVANNTIHHTVKYASHIILPVVPKQENE